MATSNEDASVHISDQSMSSIQHIQHKQEQVDIMNGDLRWEKNVLDHGSVALMDVMPRTVPKGKTADFRIAEAARVSYGAGTTTISTDEGLINYLWRNVHTTPFEMVKFTFLVHAPIFVARQWMRHRMGSFNEYSARYSILEDKFYHPDEPRMQSTTNNQGSSDEPVPENAKKMFYELLTSAENNYDLYREVIDSGVSRELARMALPVSGYTKFYWSVDLKNLLHFLHLRGDAHAQREIQLYAHAIMELIRPIVPVTLKAFENYTRDAMTLTSFEIQAIRDNKPISQYTSNKREQSEFVKKCQRLNLCVPE